MAWIARAGDDVHGRWGKMTRVQIVTCRRCGTQTAFWWGQEGTKTRSRPRGRPGITAAAARQAARSDGWSRKANGYWYCKECK